jgi:transketolase
MDNNLTVGLAQKRPLGIEDLQRMAAQIRIDLLEMIHTAGEGHPGGSLSAVEAVTALYFRVMRLDPTDPYWPDRDRFVLSKGHACPVLYSALTELGYLERGCLCSLRCIDSQLQGHPDMRKTPGVEMTAGSLGQGFSAGLGMALAARAQGRPSRIWVMVGDGEMQEGAVWEAAMAAAAFRVDNLTVILDRNRIQNDDFVDTILPMGAVADKWSAFGWHVIEIDGHDMAQMVQALEASRQVVGQPTVIVAQTIKGKGVSFMEDNPAWHGRAPNDEELARALGQVRAAAGLEDAV